MTTRWEPVRFWMADSDCYGAHEEPGLDVERMLWPWSNEAWRHLDGLLQLVLEEEL